MTHVNSTFPTADMNVSVVPKGIEWTSFISTRDDMMSFQTLQTVEKTVVCGFIPSLYFVGAPTNILNMIIFYRQGLRDRMNLCLLGLAFVDLMLSTALFVMALHCFVGIILPDQEIFWTNILTSYMLPFVFGFGYSSGCLTMIIALERCVCVMFPMKAATLISTKTMVVVLSVVVVLIHSLCGVFVVKEKASLVEDTSGNQQNILSTSELYLSNIAFKFIDNVVLPALSFINFTSVLLATAVTVVRLRSAMTWRESKASSYLKGQASLIRMLVMVCCIYMVCLSPKTALALTRLTVPEFRSEGRYGNVFLATHMIDSACVIFNSSIPFFVYVTMSSRFRHELKRLCSRNVKSGLSLKLRNPTLKG